MPEKAQIKVLDGPRRGEIIKVMYNPSEYSEELESDTTVTNNQIQFSRVKKPDFTVKLFFDTYESQTDVREKTQKIVSLQLPDFEMGANVKRPSKCIFVWGTFSYRGIVTKCSQRYTMFLSSGIPVRSELSVTFKAVLSPDEIKKLGNQTESRKFWTVKSNDRLDLIADRVYQDPGAWKIIAAANQIEDPLLFPESYIGAILIIPER